MSCPMASDSAGARVCGTSASGSRKAVITYIAGTTSASPTVRTSWRTYPESRSARCASRLVTAHATLCGPWIVSASVNMRHSPVASAASCCMACVLPHQPARGSGRPRSARISPG